MTQSEKKSICILLDPAHGQDTHGKHSPDCSLREYQWSRLIIEKMIKKLQDDGYRAIKITEDVNEIGLANRVQIEHNYSNYFGRQNTVFVSVHVNAAGNKGEWMKANGWQCHIAKNASDKSKKLSSLLYKEIENAGLKVRRPKPKQDYWQNDFYVLKNTYCAAVLIESFFMDNKDDCKYLLSREGQETITKCYVNAIEKYVNEMIVK